MRWVDTIVQEVRPAFGGVPTFCVDPDHLLEMPELREALRASGVSIHEWDSQAGSLVAFRNLPSTERPLVVVNDSAKRHVVESCLPHHAWASIAVSSLMPKYPREVVKAVPTSKWDTLLAIHDEVRSPRSPLEAALLVARAAYGIDVEFLKHGDGWLRLLAQTAVNGEGIPEEVAKAVCEQVAPPGWLRTAPAAEALADPTVARQAVIRGVTEHPELLETAPHSEQVLVSHIRKETGRRRVRLAAADLLDDWERCAGSPATMLAFAVRYGAARATEAVSPEQWRQLDTQFTEWVQASYGLMLSSPNPEVLRAARLLRHIDEEVGEARLLLVVVDALSLQAWPRVEAQWKADGAISGAVTHAAFAVLPSITSLGRRALFEGKPPAQFTGEAHSQRLERQLWAERYSGAGEYYVTDEETGLLDAVAKGRERLCVLDASWDRRGHAVDPRVDSVPEAARVWASKSRIAVMVKEALQAGYRVFVTSDHGQVECQGIGRPNVGVLPDEKGRRVLLFSDKALSESHASVGTMAYRPAGLPPSIFPLFALGEASFDIAGAQAVSHGGMSLDEAIVPVAEVMA